PAGVPSPHQTVWSNLFFVRDRATLHRHSGLNGMSSSMSRLREPPAEDVLSSFGLMLSERNFVPFLLVLIQAESQYSTPSTLSVPLWARSQSLCFLSRSL